VSARDRTGHPVVARGAKAFTVIPYFLELERERQR